MKETVPMIVAAVDPGREKCGVAVVAGNGDVLEQSVVPTERLVDEMEARVRRFSPERILLGNGTTSRAAETAIREVMPGIPVEIVDEYRTTDDARRAYWKAHPRSREESLKRLRLLREQRLASLSNW